jgi:hypothetical protein
MKTLRKDKTLNPDYIQRYKMFYKADPKVIDLSPKHKIFQKVSESGANRPSSISGWNASKLQSRYKSNRIYSKVIMLQI